MTVYDQIAHYYDLTHAGLVDDIPFLLRLAGEAGGPILELGCGTGRLLRPLANAGYHLTGIDNSVAMLGRAEAYLQQESAAVQQRVTLQQADMVDFVVEGAFSLVIVPYNTLMHLTPTQMGQVFRRVQGCLASNGRFVIDLANPMIVANTSNDHNLTLENQFIDPETGHLVLQMASNWLDEAAQTLQITWLYDATPVAGGMVQRLVATAVYHYLFPHQIELLLREAGLKLLQISGGYNGEPFTEESDRLIVTAGQ